MLLGGFVPVCVEGRQGTRGIACTLRGTKSTMPEANGKLVLKFCAVDFTCYDQAITQSATTATTATNVNNEFPIAATQL